MENREDKRKSITLDDVRYVAGLARLEFNEGELVKFQEQLAGILSYVDQLNEADTENTSPTTHVLSSMKNVFREDELVESISSEEAVKNAPEKKGGFFKVPKIIEDA